MRDSSAAAFWLLVAPSVVLAAAWATAVIEHEQQPVLELVGALDQVPGHAVEGFRGALEGVFLGLDHVADLVHEQAHGAVVAADHDVHRQPVAGAFGEPEAAAQVDGGHDLAAQVNQPAHDP